MGGDRQVRVHGEDQWVSAMEVRPADPGQLRHHPLHLHTGTCGFRPVRAIYLPVHLVGPGPGVHAGVLIGDLRQHHHHTSNADLAGQSGLAIGGGDSLTGQTHRRTGRAFPRFPAVLLFGGRAHRRTFLALFIPFGMSPAQVALSVLVFLLVVVSGLWIGILLAAVLKARLGRTPRGRDMGQALALMIALPLVAVMYGIMNGGLLMRRRGWFDLTIGALVASQFLGCGCRAHLPSPSRRPQSVLAGNRPGIGNVNGVLLRLFVHWQQAFRSGL